MPCWWMFLHRMLVEQAVFQTAASLAKKKQYLWLIEVLGLRAVSEQASPLIQ